MSGREARDDERDALARLLRTLDFRGADPLTYFYHRAYAILDAGYRKHPEPEITHKQRDAALREWDAHSWDPSSRLCACGEVFPAVGREMNGHPQHRMRAALEAALRAPVGEGETDGTR